MLDHLVDQAVLPGFRGGHEVVAVGIGRNAVERLPGVVGEDRLDAPLQVEHLPRADLDVGRLAAEAAGQTWWMRIFAFGSALLLLFAPAASSTAPIDIAVPTQMVRMSGLTNVSVS